MGRLREKLAHAFAVDPPGPVEPTPQEQVAVDWVCRQIAMRHLTTPGLVGLELLRPLNYVTAQLMHFSSPGAWAVLPQAPYEHYRAFAAFLERRGSIEYMARRVEHFEAEFEEQEKGEHEKGGA